MKIIHVLPFFLPDTVGGTEVYVWSLCKYLLNNGIETEVLIPNYNQPEYETYLYDGIKITKYPETTVPNRKIYSGISVPDGISYFSEYIKKTQPDWVHFHAIYGSTGITIQHLVEVKQLNFKVAYTMHLAGDICHTSTLIQNQTKQCDGVINIHKCTKCSLMHRGYNTVVAELITSVSNTARFLNVDAAKHLDNPIATALSLTHRLKDKQKNLKRIEDNCDKIISLTNWFVKILKANGISENKIVKIEQAVPLGTLNHHNNNTSEGSYNKVNIIFIGRISPLKGVDLLIEAVKSFPKDNVGLQIYGKAVKDDFYNECLASSNAYHNIQWLGYVSRDKVLDVLQQADILCLPSAFSEMSPLVIQEAFLAGVPVIASNVYGNSEQIREGVDGLLFTFKSLEDLKKKINQVLVSPTLLSQLKKGIKTPNTFDTVGEKYIKMYQNLI